MQESRAPRDISVSKQRPTQSRSVGPSISDAVAAHRFPTDWRLTVRRVGRKKRVSLMRSRHGAVGSLWVMDDVQDALDDDVIGPIAISRGGKSGPTQRQHGGRDSAPPRRRLFTTPNPPGEGFFVVAKQPVKRGQPPPSARTSCAAPSQVRSQAHAESVGSGSI
jgi:hypothetical protein